MRTFGIFESGKLVSCPYCSSKIAPQIDKCPQCSELLPKNQNCPICVRPIYRTDFKIIRRLGNDRIAYHSECPNKLYNFPIVVRCSLCKKDLKSINNLDELLSYNDRATCSTCGHNQSIIANSYCNECNLPILYYYGESHGKCSSATSASGCLLFILALSTPFSLILYQCLRA